MTVKTQQFYYNLLLQGYMFRLLRVIIRPSIELTQDYVIRSALWDPVAFTVGGETKPGIVMAKAGFNKRIFFSTRNLDLK